MSLHEIPDDGWPHAPTSECGCGPQLRYTGHRYRGRVSPVLIHLDMRPVRSVEDWNELVAQVARERAAGPQQQ